MPPGRITTSSRPTVPAGGGKTSCASISSLPTKSCSPFAMRMTTGMRTRTSSRLQTPAFPPNQVSSASPVTTPSSALTGPLTRQPPTSSPMAIRATRSSPIPPAQPHRVPASTSRKCSPATSSTPLLTSPSPAIATSAWERLIPMSIMSSNGKTTSPILLAATRSRQASTSCACKSSIGARSIRKARSPSTGTSPAMRPQTFCWAMPSATPNPR
jgi:hypothetical protein